MRQIELFEKTHDFTLDWIGNLKEVLVGTCGKKPPLRIDDVQTPSLVEADRNIVVMPLKGV